MRSLILAIVVFILGLFLASWVYFTDKSATKKAKLVILIIVFLAAVTGIWSEIVKYYDDKDKGNKLSELIGKYSKLDTNYNRLSSNYSSLTEAYGKLNGDYTDILTAIKIARLTYDSNTKQFNNIGSVKNANFGNMSGGHVGDNYTQNLAISSNDYFRPNDSVRQMVISNLQQLKQKYHNAAPQINLWRQSNQGLIVKAMNDFGGILSEEKLLDGVIQHSTDERYDDSGARVHLDPEYVPYWNDFMAAIKPYIKFGCNLMPLKGYGGIKVQIEGMPFFDALGRVTIK